MGSNEHYFGSDYIIMWSVSIWHTKTDSFTISKTEFDANTKAKFITDTESEFATITKPEFNTEPNINSDSAVSSIISASLNSQIFCITFHVFEFR
jgi:hypothetical protein